MLVIYTEKYTPRTKYIFEYIFEDILNQKVSFVRDIDQATKLAKKRPVLCYSRTESISGSFVIRPNGLLFGKGYRKKYDPKPTEWNDTKIFFQTEDAASANLPFDLFAASFYLVARYEEYGSADLDEKGRYKATNSLAYRYRFLEEPIVDQWAYILDDLLSKYFSTYSSNRRSRFHFRPIVDLSNLAKYRARSFTQNVGEVCLKLLKLNFKAAYMQASVVTRLIDDPWFNAANIIEVHNRNDAVPMFFVDGGKRYDFTQPYYFYYRRKICGELRRNFLVGLLAKNAGTVKWGMRKARKTLEKHVKAKVTMNHFKDFKMLLPDSYQYLSRAKVKNDYSMGYDDCPGFRAGTSRPFCFYNVELDEVSFLKIHPVVFNDRSVMRPADLFIMNYLADKSKECGGEFVSLLHNTTLAYGDEASYDWRMYYEKSLNYVSSLECGDHISPKS